MRERNIYLSLRLLGKDIEALKNKYNHNSGITSKNKIFLQSE